MERYLEHDATLFRSRHLDQNDFTPKQESALNWTSRIAAIFSFLGGAYIFYNAWKRRGHVYHRVMLVLSIYILLWSPWMMYGAAAIPSGTPDVIGAYGNEATCTAQGFFNQLSVAIPSYYVALSGFSWIVIVYGNFDPSKYAWVEKYIHIGVNIWAIGSSTALVLLEAFNPTEGWPTCFIGSVPMGCGDDSGISCTRGPQNVSQIFAIFVGLPVFLLLLIPTILMIGLACFLHCRNYRGGEPTTHCRRITTRAVTKQSAFYLGTLYFIYTPGILMSTLGSYYGESKSFWLSCVGNATIGSMGLLFATTYRYFSSPSISGGNGIIGATRRRVSKILEPTLMRHTVRDSCMTSTAFSSGEKSDHLSVGAERNDSQQHVASNMESSTECSFSETPKPNQGQRSSEEFRQSFSFNIFDGTAPSKSQWAKFIFEGDESDEENDLEETRHWAGCQDM